jgi:hypothetical protein
MAEPLAVDQQLAAFDARHPPWRWWRRRINRAAHLCITDRLLDYDPETDRFSFTAAGIELFFGAADA